MNKCIAAKVVFASDMTYSTAIKVLSKAKELFGDRFYGYRIISEGKKSETLVDDRDKDNWEAVAYIEDIVNDFLDNPEKYLLVNVDQ